MAIGPLFPTANIFPWVGIVYIGNGLQETQPNQILRKHPTIVNTIVNTIANTIVNTIVNTTVNALWYTIPYHLERNNARKISIVRTYTRDR